MDGQRILYWKKTFNSKTYRYIGVFTYLMFLIFPKNIYYYLLPDGGSIYLLLNQTEPKNLFYPGLIRGKPPTNFPFCSLIDKNGNRAVVFHPREIAPTN